MVKQQNGITSEKIALGTGRYAALEMKVQEVRKKLPDRYVYPAVFTYEDGKEIAVVFPDIELATSGTDDADALFSAREALGGRLALMEELGENVPKASDLKDIAIAKNERAVLVDVYMPSVRMAEKT